MKTVPVQPHAVPDDDINPAWVLFFIQVRKVAALARAYQASRTAILEDSIAPTAEDGCG